MNVVGSVIVAEDAAGYCRLSGSVCDCNMAGILRVMMLNYFVYFLCAARKGPDVVCGGGTDGALSKQQHEVHSLKSHTRYVSGATIARLRRLYDPGSSSPTGGPCEYMIDFYR